MNTFFKIASSDVDARCNNIAPFYYKEMDRNKDPKTGRVITKSDVNKAWEIFMKITNSTNGRALPCCDPNIKITDVDPDLLAKVQGIYSYARPIIRNGDLHSLELTKTAKAAEAGWAPITPYIICKIGYALNNPGMLTKSPDADDVWVIGRTGLLLDCYQNSCPDSITVDNLFGTSRKDIEYTYVDDLGVAEAVKTGDVKAVRDYLFKYNSANQVLTNDDENNRLVHLAAIYYNPKVFELLVSVKANFNVRNAKGNTPLHFAVMNGSIPCLEELLKLNVEVNPKNNRGETPMMMAIAYKSKTDPKTGQVIPTEKGLNMIMVRYLYNKGGNVLDRDSFGNNMIHHIILNMEVGPEMSDAVKFMLNKGVPADQKNNAGITPLMLTSDKLAITGVDDYDPPAEIINKLTEKFKNQPKTTASKNTAVLPALNPQGVSEFDFNNLTEEQIELMEIRTMLFNDILRNNPGKFNKYVNVKEIPSGAPVQILDYNCVSATGELISDTIDTKEKCLSTPGGFWTPVRNPSTLIKLELIPENRRTINLIPDNELYYPKYSSSVDKVPLPAEIQELNREARKPPANANSNSNYNEDESVDAIMSKKFLAQNGNNSADAAASNNSANVTITEGFNPALLAGLASGHHLTSIAVGGMESAFGGFLADLTSNYIKKSDEPPIDPDNLSGQKLPKAPTRQTNTAAPTIPAATMFPSVANHPPVMNNKQVLAKEEFNAMRFIDRNQNRIRTIRIFSRDNWIMLSVFILLAIILVFYVTKHMQTKRK